MLDTSQCHANKTALSNHVRDTVGLPHTSVRDASLMRIGYIVGKIIWATIYAIGNSRKFSKDYAKSG
jgi:hypothetical protein